MKRIILLLTVFLCASASETIAQGIPCPMKCWQESFPYWFCPVTGGTPVVLCSINPDTMPGYLPSKIHMPGCVTLIQLDSSYWYQPDGPVPVFTDTPPNRWSIFLAYESSSYGPPPWKEPFPDDPGDFWDDDTLAYAVGWAQWDLDSATFLAGDTQEHTYFDNTDYDQESAYLNYTEHDYQELWEIYDEEDTLYVNDSTAYANGTDVNYTQVWNPSQSTTDADDGRLAWLACCGITGDPGCCILIQPNNDIGFWHGTYGSPDDTDVNFALGFTSVPVECEVGLTCPDPSTRYILYNTTNSFFYENNDNRIIPNPGYILHPTAPLSAFYCGTSVPARYAGYDVYSFRDVVEHEEGHWLGLNHPEKISSDSTSCINNQTQCSSHLSHPMLMSEFGAEADSLPEGLQPDDICEFQKLYCPGTGYDGVQEVETEPPSPEIFPNPTTGACQLQYVVLDRSFVQVAIYDMLGKEVKAVMSDYSDAGTQSISLGTETLPSGNYVCRVRVGDRVNYINLAITK
jgi:Secretion system C-terminal sorting domain